MIFNPTTSSWQPADDVLVPIVRPREVDLNAAGGLSQLINTIVAIANGGGGRIEVRCHADVANDAAADRVFSASIEPAEPKAVEPKADSKDVAQPNLQPVRIVTDPEAPALHPQDVDRLYPWRQKDLLRELNGRLGRRFLNSYDIQAVRRQHRLDEHPEFVFNLPGAGRRYSPAAAEWILEQYARDPEFFHAARTADHEIMRLRRQKPR
jgi:hypothetical protein